MTRNAPPEPCQHPSCAGMPPMPDPTTHKIVRGHPIAKVKPVATERAETAQERLLRAIFGEDK